MPDLTYIDRENVTHTIEVVRKHDLPGFWVCHSDVAGRFFLHRADIRIDGVPTTADREHLLEPQPEEQS